MPPRDTTQENSSRLPASNIRDNHQLERASIDAVLESLKSKIAPVWPLRDYVAVNPYFGFAEHEFLNVRNYLRSMSDLELFMPIDYYRQQFMQGKLRRTHIDRAVDELVYDGIVGAEGIDVNQVIFLLQEDSGPTPTADAEFRKPENPARTLRSATELIDQERGTSWCRLISEEISKQCSSYYDQGQARWTGSSKPTGLFAAWKAEKQVDLTLEVQGIGSFRAFVEKLPQNPRVALGYLMYKLGIPVELREDYLLCIALTLPGWTAWVQYQLRSSGEKSNDDLAGLLAIRLAYEAALSQHLDFQVNWDEIAATHLDMSEQRDAASQDDLLRYALLRATEVAYRDTLLGSFADSHKLPGTVCRDNTVQRVSSSQRQLAKMIFCIDVRSERIRRQLETVSSEIETFGFAGFFGLPLEYVELGAKQGQSNVPVLISPAFQVHEQLDGCNDVQTDASAKRRGDLRFIRKAWKSFQASAVSMFAFVETTGLLYAGSLIGRSLGLVRTKSCSGDGLHKSAVSSLGPSIESLAKQGIAIEEQASMAEAMLKGIGITDSFPRLVVFCGHGSQVENNPLKAGLDCGACGGHSGKPNARVAAKLLNQREVRTALAVRGIEIPDETFFMAALHNTTTDDFEFLDQHNVPQTHRGDLQELSALVEEASEQTRQERLPSLPGTTSKEMHRRSQDWSEVRPEWGLAGNAAFIAAPREKSRAFSLDGRAFLHSYDFQKDPGFEVLEQIMTAPMVVANWINMQYYASTVDPLHFGSGNKTVHNVVGQFGVLSGNSGDLMTGLPWQSVHDGKNYQHHPLRLLVVLAAPKEAIESVLSKHKIVADLSACGWLQLVAMENEQFYRLTERQAWEQICHADTLYR